MSLKTIEIDATVSGGGHYTTDAIALDGSKAVVEVTMEDATGEGLSALLQQSIDGAHWCDMPDSAVDIAEGDTQATWDVALVPSGTLVRAVVATGDGGHVYIGKLNVLSNERG